MNAQTLSVTSVHRLHRKTSLKEFGSGCLLLLFFSISVFADTHYVSLSGSHTAPFTDWMTAATNIQAAIDVTLDGDTVLVTNGIYATGERAFYGANRVAITKPVRVRSVNGPAMTIIEGARLLDGPVRCAYVCALAGNSASDYVGCGGGTLGGTLYNCTLTGKGAFCGGGAYNGTFDNCIVYYNTAPSDSNYYGCTLNYSCTTPDPGGVGNITNDPRFVNAAAGNYHLQSTSPCINAGTNQDWMIGATDLDGNPRLDASGHVDMGAYEYQGMSIWPNTTAPVVVDSGPDSAVELGVKFRSDIDGTIAGIRFYKAAANTGVHIGNLWASDGMLLTTVIFSNETASGWQEALFDTPVAIASNTVYVASYHADNGHYSADLNYFLEQGVDNPPLHMLMNGVFGGNGVYAYGASSVFPNQSYNAANYWVDVIFQTATPITLTSIVMTPENPGILIGASQQFTAVGTYSDGSTRDITRQVTWISSESGVATINAGGLAMGISAGTTMISASLAGVTDSTILTVQPASSPIHYVSLSGGHVSPFTSWATAATNIQAAVDVARDGETVLVTNGGYNSGGAVTPGYSLSNRVVIAKPIRVQSVNGPAFTFIVGQGPSGETAVRCAYLTNGAQLCGFTLANGHTRDVGDINDECGGGVFLHRGTMVSNCVLTCNSVVGEPGRGGGAFSIELAEGGLLVNCVLEENSAVRGGGAYGGELRNCIIRENTAGYGGGVKNALLRNCLVVRNSAWGICGGAKGCDLVNCTVSGNGNGGAYEGGGMVNSVLYDNEGYNYTQINGPITYTCTTPLASGEGNVASDPQFVNLAVGNYRLQSISPCINAGTNQAWMVGATDLDGNPRLYAGGRVDMGAYASHAGIDFLDSDHDFIPNAWEVAHGLNPHNASDGHQHLNGDKLTNLEKYLVDLDPRIPTGTLNHAQLVQLYERKSSLFFWGEAKEGNHFLVPDRSPIDGGSASNSDVSVAGVGFQIASYVVADERGWQDHGEIYNRIVTILRYMRDLQDPSRDRISHKRGFFFHFLDTNGNGTSEVSSVDHALFLQGALLAAEYYKGTEVERLANEIYDNTDWPFFASTNSTNGFLCLAWQGGRLSDDSWNRYSEETAMYLLAAGSTTHPISNPRQVWNSISRPGVQYTSPVTGESFPEYVHVGALFAHQFSQAYVDFRGMRDDALIDYFNNSVTASLVNRRFAFNLNATDSIKYDTYVHNDQTNVGVWGLSSADRSVGGYGVIQPIFPPDPGDIENNNDSGTVVPMAMIGSMPFIPGEVERDLRYLFDHRETLFTGEPIDGVYGFVNAYNPGQALSGTRHISRYMIGLDAGTAVLNMENYRSGMPWKFFRRLPGIQNGLSRMGFADYVSRPNIMNFDNGSDPNVFGGYGGGFGTPAATSVYTEIVDPFPEPYGPQGFVQEITVSAADAGAWFGLNRHDVSRWDRVSFWIRGNQGGESVKIGLKDASQNEFQVPVSDYLSGGITTNWQEVRIPLRVFQDQGVRMISMDNISFTFAGTNGGKFFVDDIAFLGDEFRPAPPPNVTASVQNSVVTLEWDWNSEPDVVGYRILRKTVSDQDFVDITPAGVLWVGNTFTNDVPGIAGDIAYRVIAVDNSTFRNQSDPALVTVDATPLSFRITSIECLADHSFQLAISHSEGVYSYRIQYSDDAGQTWKFAQEIVLANPSGTTLWIDNGTTTIPEPSEVNMRWYRAMGARNAVPGRRFNFIQTTGGSLDRQRRVASS